MQRYKDNLNKATHVSKLTDLGKSPGLSCATSAAS